ncbi:hypothetical protein SCHPADRAFT_670170 [Schizopora paradoxa]|uniref:Uncharacterized protein n=1 Tax=Schizopora paradoxa TaxID=27342 RepID=A0A0H2R556_9AGAM|nr:hypothetical protein SCHPADRAFT_670170 [Schizopora paradoxa]
MEYAGKNISRHAREQKKRHRKMSALLLHRRRRRHLSYPTPRGSPFGSSYGPPYHSSILSESSRMPWRYSSYNALLGGLNNGFQRNPSKIFNSMFLSRMSSVALMIIDVPWNRRNELHPLSLDFLEKLPAAPKQINIPFSSLGTNLSPLASHLAVLEINSTFDISLDNLNKLSKTLLPIRTSLQSLRLSRRPFSLGSSSDLQQLQTEIVLDLPALQELVFDALAASDVFALMFYGNLECTSLTSLVIRTLILSIPAYDDDSDDDSDDPDQLRKLIEVIGAKFPRLQRFAYSPICSKSINDEFIAVFSSGRVEVSSLDILMKAQTQVSGGDLVTSTWLLPNLEVLELTLNPHTLEWLLSFVSARMLSPDVANINTIFLTGIPKDLEEKDGNFNPPCLSVVPHSESIELDPLRLLVPEVFLANMPPLFSHR